MSHSIIPTAITNLVAFLTAPLTRTHSPRTLVHIKHLLEESFFRYFPTGQLVPVTFVFSKSMIPITPLLTGCIAAGLTWTEWVDALGGNDLHFFITKTSVSVGQSADEKSAVSVWKQDIEESTEVATISKTMTSVPSSPLSQQRRPSIITTCNAIKLPSLISPTTSDDSDYDSDNESTTSSRFSFASSNDYLSSSSSDVYSPITPADEPKLPFSNKKGYSPLSTKPSSPVPTRVNPKATVTKYLYQGGSTNVVTGGVMLGVASKPAVAPVQVPFLVKKAQPTPPLRAPIVRAPLSPKKPSASKADVSSNWRQRPLRA